MRRIIDGKTGISLALLIPVVAFAVWCTRLEARVNAGGEDVARIERRLKAVNRIERRLFRLEIKLGVDKPEPIPLEPVTE